MTHDRSRALRRAALSLLTSLPMLLLGACGGGGSEPAPPVTPQVLTLDGTVAVGAPMTDATLTVLDAHGATATAAIAADGSYAGLSLDGMTAPFRLRACGFVNGGTTCYYAVARSAGTANVTPLTHAALTLALGGDPAVLFDGTDAPDVLALAAQEDRIANALGPLLLSLGIDPATVDFTTTAFAADRTGLDKLLDALKINVGQDGAGATFVQVEGNLASGNVYLDSAGTASGSISSGGAGVDLAGVGTLFTGLASAVGSPSAEACASAMGAAHLFDAAFSMNMDGGMPLDAASAPAGLCMAISQMNMLGAMVANPVLDDCDVGRPNGDSVCVIDFDLIDTVSGEAFTGAQLAIVQHAGSTAWALLGTDGAFSVHVNAAAQRMVRIDTATPVTSYTRAISFDIAAQSNDGTQSVALARVYQHAADGTGWDAVPIATLDLPAGCGSPRLTIAGSSCGSTWMSVDGWSQAGADGDALIDNFYRRGRRVKIELYADAAGTQLVATQYKRVDGVPPKSAALAGQPWPAISTGSISALVALDAAATAYAFDWTSDRSVQMQDATFCVGDMSCQSGGTHVGVPHGGAGAGTVSMALQGAPASAAAFRELSIFARDRDGLGLATNYVSCAAVAADQPCQ